MYSNINIQFICAECPKGMNKQNCPAREYIHTESELFHESVNENVITLAKPYLAARADYEKALADIAAMCENCKTQR